MGRKKDKNESKPDLAHKPETGKVVIQEEKKKQEDSEIVESVPKEEKLSESNKNPDRPEADKQEVLEQQEISVKEEKPQLLEAEFPDVYEDNLDKIEGKVETHDLESPDHHKTEASLEKNIEKSETGEEILEKNEPAFESGEKAKESKDVLVESIEEKQTIHEEIVNPDKGTEEDTNIAEKPENKTEEEPENKTEEEPEKKFEKNPSTDEKTYEVLEEKPLETEKQGVLDREKPENPVIEDHKEKLNPDYHPGPEDSKVDPKSLETQEIHENPEENTEKEAIISGPSETHNTKSYSTEFSIFYQTSFGEKIVLVGSSSELGNWEPEQGFELKWEPDHIWKGAFSYDTLPFEYKYVLVGNNGTLWEKGVNRKITEFVPTVIDEWQPI